MWITRDRKSQWVEIWDAYHPYTGGDIVFDQSKAVQLHVSDFKKLFSWTPKQLRHYHINDSTCEAY